MEISSMTSPFGLETRMLATATATATSRSRRRRSLNVSAAAKFSSGTNVVSPLFGGSVSTSSDFSSHSIRPSSPLSSSSFSSSPPRIKRNVITMVIPFMKDGTRQPPPDLASYLFVNRIVYLGMPLYPAVIELITAELLYLNYESTEKPIHLYINSTGAPKGESQYGYLGESLAVHDTMNFVKAPVYTLAVGNAWGEAALLLAAGEKGNRAATPSASIMLKQPSGMGQGQASAVANLRTNIKKDKETLIKFYADYTGKDREQLEKDIRRPKYFSPAEALEYGIIDKIISNKRAIEDNGLF